MRKKFNRDIFGLCKFNVLIYTTDRRRCREKIEVH